MHRVYIYKNELIFLEDANSPLGRHVGLIIATGPGTSDFFQDRFLGIDAGHLQIILNKMRELNAASLAQSIADGPAPEP